MLSYPHPLLRIYRVLLPSTNTADMRLLGAIVLLCCSSARAAIPDWPFANPLERPLVVCTASIADVTSRCSRGQYIDLQSPEPNGGWCSDGGDFCGYDLDLWWYVLRSRAPAPVMPTRTR